MGAVFSNTGYHTGYLDSFSGIRNLSEDSETRRFLGSLLKLREEDWASYEKIVSEFCELKFKSIADLIESPLIDKAEGDKLKKLSDTIGTDIFKLTLEVFYEDVVEYAKKNGIRLPKALSEEGTKELINVLRSKEPTYAHIGVSGSIFGTALGGQITSTAAPTVYTTNTSTDPLEEYLGTNPTGEQWSSTINACIIGNEPQSFLSAASVGSVVPTVHKYQPSTNKSILSNLYKLKK